MNLSSQWRHNGRNRVAYHQPHDCLLNRLFSRSKKTSKLRVTGLCAGNSPVTGEFPAQMASNAENISIWWRHHVLLHFTSAIFMLSNRNPYYNEWCPSLYPKQNSVHMLYNNLKSTYGNKSSLLYAGRLDCKPGIIHTDRMSNETGIRNGTGENQWLSWRLVQNI